MVHAEELPVLLTRSDGLVWVDVPVWDEQALDDLLAELGRLHRLDEHSVSAEEFSVHMPDLDDVFLVDGVLDRLGAFVLALNAALLAIA